MSYRDSSSRYGDRPRKQEAEGNNPAQADDENTDKKLSAAADITEAPKPRPVLKPGPAGGAYIPPFRLQQVLLLVLPQMILP